MEEPRCQNCGYPKTWKLFYKTVNVDLDKKTHFIFQCEKCQKTYVIDPKTMCDREKAALFNLHHEISHSFYFDWVRLYCAFTELKNKIVALWKYKKRAIRLNWSLRKVKMK